MERTEEKQKFNDLAFYFLMGILTVSVLYIIGYLVYDMLFG
ncbi:MAG: hypothetical protein N2249_07515 [Melioribacter sp.]|nr:hypothetical protein [Melioribacter sp.]